MAHAGQRCVQRADRSRVRVRRRGKLVRARHPLHDTATQTGWHARAPSHALARARWRTSVQSSWMA